MSPLECNFYFQNAKDGLEYISLMVRERFNRQKKYIREFSSKDAPVHKAINFCHLKNFSEYNNLQKIELFATPPSGMEAFPMFHREAAITYAIEIIPEHLTRMTCESLSIKDTKISIYTINEFLKRWQTQGGPKSIRKLYVNEVYIPVITPVINIVRGLNAASWDASGKPNIHKSGQDCTKGWAIRQDGTGGKRATVLIEDFGISKSFLFLMWD
ncbi:hypothetical protein L5515_017551 [Caenorhabditis briggsae]|uniref:F-box associated domain-containing protein n=1 Tax=Caenorhabditis briggsae TaxID=6238 RepID=A0AAE9FGT8_CAEBR|nr:hypothetical protein L5515_017551 [Caenorhabditis briggsae]